VYRKSLTWVKFKSRYFGIKLVPTFFYTKIIVRITFPDKPADSMMRMAIYALHNTEIKPRTANARNESRLYSFLFRLSTRQRFPSSPPAVLDPMGYTSIPEKLW
jgi:hypothetical protein